MGRKVQVVPGELTRSGARAGIVVAALMLVFGLVFFVVTVEGPGSEPGLFILQVLFFGIFITACAAMIVHMRKLLRRRGDADPASLVDLHLPDGDREPGAAPTFAGRLRELEALRKEGLISAAEYREKRAEIMGEKW
jgi:hypothetical protein